MKYIYGLYFFFLTIGGWSQNLKVEYEVIYNKPDHLDHPANVSDSEMLAYRSEMKRTIPYYQYIDYVLLIDGQESLFYMEKGMEKDGEFYMGIARVLAGYGSGKYYSNFRTKEKLHLREAYGALHLITVPFKSLNWELAEETKMIMGYKTYKAHAHKMVENSSGVHEIKVIAWFAPTINKPFGPGLVGGLPGLILELHSGQNIHRVTSIETTEEEIEKPTKGERITKAEFVALGKKINGKIGI